MILIHMLQRTENLGSLIMMMSHMVDELQRFFIAFGLLIFAFVIVGRELNEELKTSPATLYQTLLDIFDGLMGKPEFDYYTRPQGQAFIAIFVYLFKVMLLSLLVAMFINKY